MIAFDIKRIYKQYMNLITNELLINRYTKSQSFRIWCDLFKFANYVTNWCRCQLIVKCMGAEMPDQAGGSQKVLIKKNLV